MTASPVPDPRPAEDAAAVEDPLAPVVPFARRTAPTEVDAIGRARVDRRTKRLLERVQAGEVAVIDHRDLDRVAAAELVAAGVAAVVNAAPSMTGRYPNPGPLVVVAAGIPLVDGVGEEALERIVEGDAVAVAGEEVWVGDRLVARGAWQTLGGLEDQLERARRQIGDELERFATNTLTHLRHERHLATDDLAVPDIGVAFAGRHALVVVRGHDYREDLLALKRTRYVEERRPVLVGVDGGADALRELGYRPDVIVGDFDSVAEATLRCGAKLVVHAYPGGAAPGAARLEALGLAYTVFEAPGTSEDIALLLAHEGGAELIVAVGSHTSMEEFLDKGRAGMASTFLVRLRVGRTLVDAKGVSRLYRPSVPTWPLVALVLAALTTLLVVTFISPALRLWLRSLWMLL